MSAIQYLKNDRWHYYSNLDSPSQSANTMNADFRVALENIVSKLKSKRIYYRYYFSFSEKNFLCRR